jgi:long-chain acyl-CoA synthetase
MFLGVPRIWEKLHSAISIKMQEAGALQRQLYQRAMAACEPFAHKAPAQRSFAEKLTYAAAYWLVFRALQNFIGLRRARIALTGAAPISPLILRYFRTLGVPLVEVYGMTESSGMVLGQRTDAIRWGTVGEPTKGVERAWPTGRAAGARRRGVPGLLQEPRGHRGHHRRRLAAHRRRGAARRTASCASSTA